MTIKEIIQKLNTTIADHRGHESHFESWLTLIDGICEAIDALKSLDNQEPVAYGMWDTMIGYGGRMMSVRLDKGQDGCSVPLYTTPPQRTWVRLTDEELYKIHTKEGWNGMIFAHAIEAKLKQKNGYAEDKNT